MLGYMSTLYISMSSNKTQVIREPSAESRWTDEEVVVESKAGVIVLGARCRNEPIVCDLSKWCSNKAGQ